MRKRVWKSIENYTLTKKILVAFLIVTIPLTTVLFGVTAYSQNVIQKEVSRSNQTLLDSCIRQIDTRLQEADAYLDKVKFRSSSEISWSYADETEYILMLQTLRNQLRRDLVSASPADALFIYDSARQRVITTESELGEKLSKEALFGHVQKFGPSKSSWQVQKEDAGMLIYKTIYVKSDIYIGVIFKDSRLMPELNTLEEYSSIQLLTNQEADEIRQKEKGEYLVISEKSRQAPLQIRLQISKKAILKPLYVMKKIQYIMPVLILAVALLYIGMLKKAVVKPIKVLENAMQQVGKGDWDIRIEEEWKGEFSSIVHGFNDMVEHIHNLKIDTYDKKIQLQKAEYRYLQMQINPHFYINTLNILYNMSVLNENANVQQLAIYLSNHFKYIQESDQHLTELNKEIQYTENYLKINQMRFGDNLRYHIQVEPEHNNYYIPMITIQTFVENCIMHGFKKRDQAFLIEIFVHPWSGNPGQYFEVEIQDSGVGFDEHYLACYDTQEYPKEFHRHIGIKNTIWRLRLWYGGDCKICLENRPGGGASVRLILPNERREFGKKFDGENYREGEHKDERVQPADGRR